MSSSESDMGSGERGKCGCEGVSHGQTNGQSDGSKKNEKCSCHGNESFEKWKEEILSKGCKGTSTEKRKNGKKKEEGCEIFKAMSKKVQQEPDKCGCSCCSIVLCAAVLIAAGVTVAFIKKKYLD